MKTPRHRDGASDAGRRAAEIEARLEDARHYFRRHHVQVEPDAGFADRVVARIRWDPAESLGWAALRLLPASVVLALVLILVSLQTTSGRETTISQSSDDDVLSWLLEGRESAP